MVGHLSSSPRSPASTIASAVGRDDRLGHDASRKIASSRIGSAGLAVDQARGARVDLLAVLADQQHGADDALLSDRAVHRRVEPRGHGLVVELVEHDVLRARIAHEPGQGATPRSLSGKRQATAKLVPQPQLATAFGFLIWNDWPIRSST